MNKMLPSVAFFLIGLAILSTTLVDRMADPDSNTAADRAYRDRLSAVYSQPAGPARSEQIQAVTKEWQGDIRARQLEERQR